MVEPLFSVKVKCVYCEIEFNTSRVRPSFKKTTKTDTDFGIHYKDVNPEYYVVRVCPFCGLATTENFVESITRAQRSAFEDKVKVNWSMKDYSGERSWDEAMQCYKLALVCAQIKGEKDRIIAGILHHIAWLYREKENAEQEIRFLRFALNAYIEVYETEGVSLNNAKLMFLIGELHRRLGEFNEAVKWFARVVNDKRIMDAAMIKASRDQWATTREDMIAAKMEMPEDGIIEKK
ncbi:DUF2225 domain-containing protein [Paenibacillus psychroresistens]|uniref:DUF2225 domain-containing protein n=1 Tax=Paenibacillus psychroresistens TaxID=1778678 RepID=A0A6B8RGX7_9BACL|nr:DUF2225 domain-containing protein [Paenibacillus psychroresistens]